MTLEVILQILCETGMSPGRRFLERYLRGWWSCLSKSAPIVLLRGTQNWLGSQQSHGLSISPYRVSLIFLSENIYPEETCSFGYTQFSNTLKIHITCIIYIYNMHIFLNDIHIPIILPWYTSYVQVVYLLIIMLISYCNIFPVQYIYILYYIYIICIIYIIYHLWYIPMVSHNRLVGCIPPGQELCQLLLAYSAEPSLHDVMGVSARRRHHSPRYRMIYDRIYIYIYN